ncbi:ABC transporter permease, partial [Filifactor alocis]|uniref:ABC transporter permease n=1 Tax=Filifactor alocis TaxID=143361 RepID=UPI003C6FD687
MTKLEIKKVFNNRKNRLLIIAAFLGAIVFSIFAIHSFRFVDANDNITTGISSPRLLIEEKNKWKGEITPDTLSEIIKAYKNGEWQSTYDIIFSASRMLKGDPVENLEGNEISKATLNEINSFYEIYRKNLDLESKDNGDTSKQIDFLQKQYQKIKTPFYYEAADSWETMFLYATTYSLILIIITSFLTSGIFSEEFKYNTFLVFFSTKYGKSKCVKCKIYAGLIVTSLVYWIGISLLSIICFGVMGTSGSSTLYQVYSPFSMYVVSMRGLYTIIVLSG